MSGRSATIAAGVLACGLIFLSPKTAAQPQAEHSAAVQLGPAVDDVVRQFYGARAKRDAWLSGVARQTALHLLDAASRAVDHGLCPPLVSPSAVRDSLAALDPALASVDAGALDTRVTQTLAAFLLDLGLGRHTVVTGETLSVRPLNVASLLQQAAIGRPAREILEVAQPRHREYRRLRDTLRSYLQLANLGGWPSVPEDLRLHPERPADPAHVDTLISRLVVTGDFVPAHAPGSAAVQYAVQYKGEIVQAVRSFQGRHGLTVDGIVGPNTVAALNVPVDVRLQQMAMSMDRWRRLPDFLGDRHVRVNIPAFELTVFDRGLVVLEMRTVVGTPENQTPVFSDRIRYLEFNPYWNVPDSITQEELAPRAAEHPDYLEERGFQVLDGWQADAELIDPSGVDWEAERFGYRLRQLPGPDNALGLVKFMFPNRYSVYLHDTPARHLFTHADRARSHGCVRVEKPDELAAFLLRETGDWPIARVEDAMHARERQVVRLPSPVPVHLLYLTAWVDDTGQVQFREDIYGRDAQAASLIGCLAADT